MTAVAGGRDVTGVRRGAFAHFLTMVVTGFNQQRLALAAVTAVAAVTRCDEPRAGYKTQTAAPVAATNPHKNHSVPR